MGAWGTSIFPATVGSRYWKGAVKKGLKIMRDGVRQLNVVKGTASVIGSVSGGLLSSGKTLF